MPCTWQKLRGNGLLLGCKGCLVREASGKVLHDIIHQLVAHIDLLSKKREVALLLGQ
jgi:hypothetical protein